VCPPDRPNHREVPPPDPEALSNASGHAQSVARECGHSSHAWHRAMRYRYGHVLTAGQFVPFDRHRNLLPPAPGSTAIL
jgi:hypothetical protein